MWNRTRIARKSGLLTFFAAGLLFAYGCLPTNNQLEDTVLSAAEAFVLDLGTSTIENLFTNFGN